MNKSKLEERREYVKTVVNSSKNTTKAVEKLANELFLAERTIWRDLQE